MSFFETNHDGSIKFGTRSAKINVKETMKVSEILDPYGNLRYKVALTSFDLEDDGKYILKYEVTVVNYFSTPDPLVIIDRPEPGEPAIYDYGYALHLYQEYVKTYTSLVRAETRDFQDVTVYKEKIGYKKVEPMCCATCKWGRKKVTPGKYIYNDTGRLECTNPENSHEYVNDLTDFRYTNRGDGHPCHRGGQHDCQHIKIYPNVDQFGVCQHYLKKMREQVPVPGQDITEFIDMRLGQRLDKKIQDVTETTVSAIISSDLSVPVSYAVAQVLSSSVASVILSAPVINIIAESNEVHGSIVNVVGNALSTDKLSGTMVYAVSSVIGDPSMSAALEVPVAAAMETPKVSASTVNIVSKSISTDVMLNPVATALSNVFENQQTVKIVEKPLAGMISTPPVSSSVIKVASEGIKISKIDGGKDYKDDDGDGKPDKSGTYDTTIIGNLGA